ncbi:uncharacterized protein PgNI_08441 [Pyricularia grisea]|uniref:Mitochondrial glyco protein n=1 Tax=Pyricularia grisea TaxID=148305 RepID=A0A6P8AWK1_PYRGI|nr:uncharacterized protein PgNI_08441 [Pyricularia grisea]TLD06611.1 hypothetical protein PgNI_08441 [Pyricularia grisea]
MMSLRTFARSAPRALSRVSSAATRRTTGSPLLKTSSFAASSLRAVSRPAAFSTSSLRRAQSGVSEELANKLDQELSFEAEVKKSEPEPAIIKDFLENTPWELKDVSGQEKVVLTRSFDNEKITLTFSIADLAADYHDQEADTYDSDPALADETADSKGRPNEVEENPEEYDEQEAAPPCRLNVVVEKPDSAKGALNIEATLSDDQIVVDNVYYFDSAELAKEQTAETAHKASAVYPGPPFGTLDEELQVLMERYLEERGVTAELAVFVPQYMDIKEQREYTNWLKNVKDFVKA